MSYRVFVVEEKYISTNNEEIILWYYATAPEDYKNLYIGDIMFESANKKLSENRKEIALRKDLKAFSKIITYGIKKTFSNSELALLRNELFLVEAMDILTGEDIEIIRKGIEVAMDKKLYLRMEAN